ncbi:MAG TPA: alpha/beta fold hydrolase [Chloroflexaceae bacterium]|nr:alpha/beta fold hydrolase [Chloroflexaceae bacterium]
MEHLITHPALRRYASPLLLLHGAWHGAWCWEAAMADLAARGFEAHALSVRGHGGSPAPAGHWRSTVLDYAREVRAAIAAVGGRPIVVGHSAGGYVAQLLVTGAVGPAPPVAGLVLLCSSPVSIGAYFLDRGLRGAPMVSLPALLRREPATVRRAFFRPNIAEAELERHRARLVAEPPLVSVSSMLLRPRPARCRAPVLVIAAERDAVFDVAAQRETAAAYGAELVVVPEAAHDLMLDPAWPVAAEAIERFAARVTGLAA